MQVIELTKTNIDIIIGVHCFFNDIEKVHFWLHLENPNLGGATPVHLMRSGRSKKLLKWINNALEENKQP